MNQQTINPSDNNYGGIEQRKIYYANSPVNETHLVRVRNKYENHMESAETANMIRDSNESNIRISKDSSNMIKDNVYGHATPEEGPLMGIVENNTALMTF